MSFCRILCIFLCFRATTMHAYEERLLALIAACIEHVITNPNVRKRLLGVGLYLQDIGGPDILNQIT